MLPFFGLTLPSGFSVNIADVTITYTTADPADAFTGYRLGTDGITSNRAGNSGSSYINDPRGWLEPRDGAAADSYECFATLNSGTLTSGTTGSWLALTADRTWTVDQTVVGIKQAQITVQIRLIGTATVLDTAVITFYAQVEL